MSDVPKTTRTRRRSFMETPTRLWISTDHATRWPVGGASIVMANSEDEARFLLEMALVDKGLSHADFTLLELNISIPFARVLCDGDY